MTGANGRPLTPINRALSAGAAFLYGLRHAAVLSASYSPALGCIHTGKQLSFVYDVADLYKTESVVPAAFLTAAESSQGIEIRVRRILRQRLHEVRLLGQAVDDLHRLFMGLWPDEPGEQADYDAGLARPGRLWDPEGEVAGGVYDDY